MLEYDKVFVLFHLAHERVDPGKVFRHPAVDERRKQRALDILDRVKCLIVIVDIDKSRDQLLLLVLRHVLMDRGLIKDIERGQKIVAVLDPDHLCVVRKGVDHDPVQRDAVILILPLCVYLRDLVLL